MFKLSAFIMMTGMLKISFIGFSICLGLYSGH